MHLLCIMHFRSPYQNAGSEVAMHTLLKAFQTAGHTCSIITTDTPQAQKIETFDGMQCYSLGQNKSSIYEVTAHLRPDAIISHHQRAEVAIPLANSRRIPSIFWLHNDFQHNLRVLSKRPSLAVFNTHWIQRKLGRGHRSLVVHPPVFPQMCEQGFRTENRVTLVNLNRDKGGEIFYQLAKELPGVGFLGVVGAHGAQVILKSLPNVSIQKHTTDMCTDVWSKTAICIMPSIYESYGMVGLEAASLGIPVLAAPTSGLKESLGAAGWFIPRENIQEYAEAIRLLLYDSRVYDERSMLMMTRFGEIDPAGELATLVETVERMTCKSM